MVAPDAVDRALVQAAEGLVLAVHKRRVGETARVATLVADAIEGALAALIELPESLLRRYRRTGKAKLIYDYRRDQAWRYGIEPDEQEKRHNWRLKDRFREESIGGDEAAISEAEADEAVQNAWADFERLICSPEAVARHDTVARVRHRLDLAETANPEILLLESLEQQVTWGHYDNGLMSRLEACRALSAVRKSQRALEIQAIVLTLRATIATNQGSDRAAAIRLASQAVKEWRRLQNRSRLVQALKQLSIAYRIDTPPGPKNLAWMQEAADLASGDLSLTASFVAERASILRATNSSEAAVRLLAGILPGVQDLGDTVREARLLQQLGQARLEAGDYDGAWEDLDRSWALTPVDYLVARCLTAASKCELFALIGESDEARRWAREAKLIADQKGYSHLGGLVRARLDSLPEVR